MTSVCFVVNELLGQNKSGGIGSTTTWRALALSAHGIDVTVLLAMQECPMDQHWLDRYAEAGVKIRWLPPTEPVWPQAVKKGVTVYRVLLAGPTYDAIVFQDWLGFGWTSATAKHAGVAFADTTLVHSVHGPTEWVLDASREPNPSAGHLLPSLAEQTSAELCDLVVAPSHAVIEWMHAQAWEVPPAHVITRLTDRHVGGSSSAEVTPVPLRPLEEIVFFGRFAESKGVPLLTAALARLGPDAIRGLRLTFLGRAATYDEPGVKALLDPEVVAALAEVRFIHHFDQPEALAYLREGGRLVVVPSYLENAPNVVAECIDHGIPMVLTEGRGVDEAVAPEDRPRLTFAPNAASLAERLRPFVAARTLPEPARAAPAEDPLVAWGRVLALPRQTPIEADRDDLLRSVMERTGADAVSCAVRFPEGDRYYFGRGLDGVLYTPTLGGPGTVWRDGVVDELGGYNDELGPRYRDAELLVRLAARGGRIVAVPEVLASVDEPDDDQAERAYRLAIEQTLRALVPPSVARWARLVSGQRAEIARLVTRVQEREQELATAQQHAGHFLGLAVKATKDANAKLK